MSGVLSGASSAAERGPSRSADLQGSISQIFYEATDRLDFPKARRLVRRGPECILGIRIRTQLSVSSAARPVLCSRKQHPPNALAPPFGVDEPPFDKRDRQRRRAGGVGSHGQLKKSD